METKPSSNPYSAPTVELKSHSVSVDFSSIIRRWERLRLFYNAVLVSIVLMVTLVAFPQHTVVPGYWVSLVIGGTVANLCFMTGPAIEGYGMYFGLWNPVMTTMLFFLGLGFTALLACLSIANF
ncbi:MAG: hypothetical protein AAF802_13240 [Planctomycetota bacterium]